jgi:hypothetical protein
MGENTALEQPLKEPRIAILCSVEALYDFTSQESNCMSFKAGTIIQVVDKHESGWWEGVLNGSRSWFPSNYVRVLQNPPLPSDRQIFYENPESTLARTKSIRPTSVIPENIPCAWFRK